MKIPKEKTLYFKFKFNNFTCHEYISNFLILILRLLKKKLLS